MISSSLQATDHPNGYQVGCLRFLDLPSDQYRYDIERFGFASEQEMDILSPFHETKTARLYLVEKVVVKVFYLSIKNQEHLSKTQNYASKIIHLPNHPNLCKVGKVDLTHYATIHCAYTQGLVLSDLIHHPRLDVPCCPHRLIRDLLQAVRFLQDHCCIWGDISTENIFLVQDEEGDWLFRLFDPSFIESCFGSGLKLDYCDPARAQFIRNGFNDMSLIQNDYWAAMVCIFELKAGRKMFMGLEQTPKLYRLVNIFKNNDQKALTIVHPDYWGEEQDIYLLLQKSVKIMPEERISISELEESILPLLHL